MATSTNLQATITALEKRLVMTPELTRSLDGSMKRNSSFYSLKGLINSKKKQLSERRHLEWLGQ